MATVKRTSVSAPIGRRRIKNHLSEVLRETVERGVAAPISNNGAIDAYLVPASTMDEVERSDRLRESLPLLMAAVAAGAAIPSKTLEDLGIEIPFDWKSVNRFTSAANVEFDLGEDGEPWVSISGFSPQPEAESDVELDF